MTAVSAEQLQQFFAAEFPDAVFQVESAGQHSATLVQTPRQSDLRPGGTVSGPTMMALADAALYAAILAEIGLVALAVTTSMTINFLRKPAPDHDIVAQCQLLKLGKSLAVGEVFIYSLGDDQPVAHVTGTYAIPQTRK